MAPWGVEFPSPGSLLFTFLVATRNGLIVDGPKIVRSLGLEKLYMPKL